jgi:ubiquinone/menaquinone biosynthesis C-methylase UbiE
VSTGDEDYQSYTRRHYMDADVAKEYARRQVSPLRAPAEWTVARLEVARVGAELARLGAGPDATVVDVPAGSGKLQPLLASRYAHYLAMDVSHAMLSHVPSDSPRVQADATKLPLRPDSVDFVVVLRLLHRVPRAIVEGVLDEALRVARFGVVVSYAGVPRSEAVHSLIRTIARRPQHTTTVLARREFAEMVSARDADVVRDASISFGLTKQRVAALRKRGAPSPEDAR